MKCITNKNKKKLTFKKNISYLNVLHMKKVVTVNGTVLSLYLDGVLAYYNEIFYEYTPFQTKLTKFDPQYKIQLLRCVFLKKEKYLSF